MLFDSILSQVNTEKEKNYGFLKKLNSAHNIFSYLVSVGIATKFHNCILYCARILLFSTRKLWVIWQVGLVPTASKCLELLAMILIWFRATCFRWKGCLVFESTMMTTSLKNSFIIRDFVSGYRRADLSSNLIMASWTVHYAYLWDIVNDYGSSWTVKACSHFSVVYFSFWSCLLFSLLYC
jgi:hypothetical protein